MQNLSPHPVGVCRQKRHLLTVVAAVSGNPLVVSESRPVVQPLVEIARAARFIQPCRIEQHQFAAERVLPYRHQNLAGCDLHGLNLMHALVLPRARIAEVGRVAFGVQQQFAEPEPCFTVILRYCNMNCVAVCKDIIPYAGSRRKFRQGSGVAPEEKQTPVAHSE